MARRLTWAPIARQDLRELVAYIAEDDRLAAGRFARGVFQAVERLEKLPEMGRVVPELGDASLREIIRAPCRIVYRLHSADRSVEIVRIWHAARGIPTLSL